MRFTSHIACKGEIGNAYNILAGNMKGGDHSEDFGID
jgi:hypothetical protein